MKDNINKKKKRSLYLCLESSLSVSAAGLGRTLFLVADDDNRDALSKSASHSNSFVLLLESLDS